MFGRTRTVAAPLVVVGAKVESTISAQIRAQIKQKVPKAQLEVLIKRTEADLDTAEAKLK